MAASSHLLHFLLRPQPSLSSSSSSSSFVSFLKPLLISSPNVLSTRLPKPFFTSLSSLPATTFSTSFSSSSLSVPHTLSPAASVGENSVENSDEDDIEDDSIEELGELETERSNFEDTQKGLESDSTSSPLERKREVMLKLEVPSLTVKERKELGSYANSLGEKLKTQLVGKSGVTSSVATSFIETLERNELLKIKIHRSCPGELDDVVKLLEESTGSVAVGQIGRTVIIYRPSLTRLKAEEKKKFVRNLILKKQKARLSKRPAPTSSRRGSTFKNMK
ncbi:putative RNA-binding, CRM domain-containing protein [Lupinus albus]|uniref:Putative RNA-binding, CRM domain-containing protein n=1 Tax=Lupinus albus TaxID=3870 RepID=A0A6A4R4P6_LUPAL|nr:putative RNA-binding, CRM domain-containing protein [Lupinus albus]